VTVRAGGEAATIERALAEAVHRLNPELVVDNGMTLDHDLARFIAPLRMITLFLAVFGVAGVLLSAMGVFGTMSYAISQRRREFAIRSALGAARPDLGRLIAGAALRMTLAGLIPGLAAAALAARALQSFLFQISPADPGPFALAAVTMVLVALAACYGPFRTASAIDPATIMRE
jgi:ABC-type antimicrobial peptide transport system permease subunit